MNTYSWSIEKVQIEPSYAGFNNVVRIVEYSVTATSEDLISTSISGSVMYDSVNPQYFTPLEELTKSKIIDWLLNTLNIENIYSTLDQKIESIRAKPIELQTIDLPS